MTTQYATGYVKDILATEQFDEQQPQAYSDSLNNLPYDLDQCAYPYRLIARYWRNNPNKLRNGRLRSRNQSSIGSCVGHGGAGMARQTAITEILVNGDPEQIPEQSGYPVDVSPSACYGMSRQVANQLGVWQGSNGNWMVNALMQMGTPFELSGLTQYTVADAAEFQRRGIPSAVAAAIKENRFGAYVRVKEPEHAVALAQNGWGMLICSGIGYSSTRDKDGFSARSGSWAHCQIFGHCYVCYHRAGKKRRGIGIWNSWGDDWNGGPLGDLTPDLPWGSYLWDYDDFALCLSRNQLEIYAVGAFTGFTRNTIWIE